MTFYQAQFILTELLMTTMIIHVLNYNGFTRHQKVWYLLTFVDIMLCSAAEFAVHNGRYNPSMAGFLTVITVLQFSLSPLLSVLFCGALGLGKQHRVAWMFLAFNLAVEASLAPTGLIFHFNQDGYFRGDLFIIYEACYFLSMIYLVAGMLIAGRRFRRRDSFTIGMILVILVAGIVPMSVFKVNVTYMAIAICACICYIYYNDLVQQDVKAELLANQKKISDMQAHMISGMASLIESRDLDTGRHIMRTSGYVTLLAKLCRRQGVYADIIDDHYILLLGMLAPMHDVGKIVVPDNILKKPGKLTDDEFEVMKKHASAGGNVVGEVLDGITDKEYVECATEMAKYHHEWWDGTGYPEGLKGEAIPLSARIMAVADVLDALVSERCYKAPIPFDDALEVMRQESGTHFDPQLIRILLKYREDFRSVHE